MRRISPLALLAWGLALAVLTADQIVKAWILGGLGLELGQSLPVWGPLHLTLVKNRGVSFGLLQAYGAWTRWALAGFEAVVAIVLMVWARGVERPLTAVAVGLIMGGAVGNLIDRIRWGAVTDFIDVQRLYFPWVFNIADSAISVGIVLLLAESFLAPAAPAPRR
jgi:signal peptidase II